MLKNLKLVKYMKNMRQVIVDKLAKIETKEFAIKACKS